MTSRKAPTGKAKPTKAKAAPAAARIPAAIAKAAPARAPAKTAARSAVVPAESRRGPTEASTPAMPTGLPARFALRARGASMEVVDTETKKHVSFPKASTGVVVKILGGLFSAGAGGEKAGEDWIDQFPEEHQHAELGLKMQRKVVAVDPSHPNVVLGAPRSHPEAYMVHAYALSVDGSTSGHLIAHGPQRFVLTSPKLQEKPTQHKTFDAAVLRIEILARGLRDRKALAKSA